MKSGFCLIFALIVVLAAVDAEKPALCNLPVKNGENGIMCAAFFPSYYYDSKSNECVYFVYGGCGGNDNRFSSVEACEAKCKNA